MRLSLQMGSHRRVSPLVLPRDNMGQGWGTPTSCLERSICGLENRTSSEYFETFILEPLAKNGREVIPVWERRSNLILQFLQKPRVIQPERGEN